MTDYQAIFRGVESTLIRVGSRRVPEATIRERLDDFKEVEKRQFSDEEYFNMLVSVVFHSGFRADTVNKKMPTIRKHFPDYETVADYGEEKIPEIIADPQMISHKGKIRACVHNARAFRAIVERYGSFGAYVDSFAPKSSFRNLMRLRTDVRDCFKYLGKTTSYHILTDIGMPVLKPDRVIRRIFHRLGLIDSDGDSEETLRETVQKGLKFAEATGEPIRYVDIVFVAYGRSGLARTGDLGIRRAICAKDNPQCEICGAREYCPYGSKRVG